MPITKTKLHEQRVFDQVRQNLLGLQKDMAGNATAHKTMAQAQSPSLAILQSFVQDSAQAYMTRLNWLQDLWADLTRRQRILDALQRAGLVQADLLDVYNPLRTAAEGLRDAPRATYAQIITACDAVLAAVDTPESLWPE